MTPQHLQALRRLLHYSAPEAARWIAADPARPRGVDDRTWNRWESGARPVPPNIAARLSELVTWRAQALAAALQALGQATADDPARLIWYEDADDWPDDRAHWRPAQSVAAALVAQLGPDRVQLLPFDARAYRAWLAAQPARLADGPEARATWAAQAPDPAPPGQADPGPGPAGDGPARPAAGAHPPPPGKGIRTPPPPGYGKWPPLAVPISIPPGLAFADLKLARDSRSGDVSFDSRVVLRICQASNLDADLFLRGPEDRLAALVVAWYTQHRAAGGAADPVAEDLLAEVRAEDAAGGGFSHPPGRA